jgi:hypothetical protein
MTHNLISNQGLLDLINTPVSSEKKELTLVCQRMFKICSKTNKNR